ncbi:MAG: hypothetical protein OEV91_03120 [Desulfobulbaceae bacterium]|nr:hypothetical protein [Desulfobulbaceae bacterium]
MKIALDISNQLPDRLQCDNIQIFSLHTLPPQLRHQYESGLRKGLLLHNAGTHKVRIKLLNNHYLAVDANALPDGVAAESRILVSLASDSEKRFVLQTVVEKMEQGLWVLRILDPRLHRRFRAGEHHPLRFWRVPPETLAKLEHGDLRLVRTKSGLQSTRIKAAISRCCHRLPHPFPREETAEESWTTAGNILDTLFEYGREKVAAEYLTLLQARFLTATLNDISLGGLCIHFAPKSERCLANRLLYMDIFCPPPPAEEEMSEASLLHLRAFAVVRAHTKSRSGENDQLHLKFLHQLPETATNCLTAALPS